VLAPSYAQQVKFGPPPAELVLDVIDELPQAQRADLLNAAKDVFPVFIFVPGVMGSQLTRTIASGPGSRVIWGAFSRTPPDLGYRDDDKVEVSLLARYGLPIGSVDVYESAINLIKNLNVSYGGDTDIFFLRLAPVEHPHGARTVALGLQQADGTGARRATGRILGS